MPRPDNRDPVEPQSALELREQYVAAARQGDGDVDDEDLDGEDLDGEDLDEEDLDEDDLDEDDRDEEDADDEELDGDEDDDLDKEFPLGDGTADLSCNATCPYCAEPVELTLDPGSGTHQEYIEDCSVCCRPWNVTVTYDEDGHADVFLDASDDR
jgi:hypothetical protein